MALYGRWGGTQISSKTCCRPFWHPIFSSNNVAHYARRHSVFVCKHFICNHEWNVFFPYVCGAFICEHGASPITRLLLTSRPLNITRFVVAIVVDSVYAVFV